MRIFLISDLHVDYSENKRWLANLSKNDYKDDILILAGDVSNRLSLLIEAFHLLRNQFKAIFFTPGNHELWLGRDDLSDSFAKFHLIVKIASDYGIEMTAVQLEGLYIVPLFGWYDYSFGHPSPSLIQVWGDYAACKWPSGYDACGVTRYFTALNQNESWSPQGLVISFSHFLPRIDLMPEYIPQHQRALYPVLGSSVLEMQIRRLGSRMHVYGHSHINRCVRKDNILYINNAFGYPDETLIAAKKLLCILEV